MDNRFYSIAKTFKITMHEAWREIEAHSRKINCGLIETESTVFVNVSEEIYKQHKLLLSDGFIGSILDIKDMIPIKKQPYIYYLYDSGVLVYIGKTNNLMQRIGSHKEDKTFDGISYMEVNKHVMGMVEELNIYYYQPILNKNGKSHLEFYKLVLNQCMFV